MGSNPPTPVDPEIEIVLDRPRRIRLDFNVISEIKASLGVDLLAEKKDVTKFSSEEWTKVMLACLREDLEAEAEAMLVEAQNVVRDDERFRAIAKAMNFVSEKTVGRWLHPGNLVLLVSKFMELWNKSIPDLAGATEAVGDDARPPEPAPAPTTG